jgi:DNA repair protein RecO (recombination protein O)
MRSYSFEGIILKRSNVGEADKLVTFLTRDHGKVTCKAKGIRKLISKRAAGLELFNHVSAHAINGKGDLDTLTEVRLISSFFTWKKHIGRVNLAYQLCETIDRLLPDREPQPELFDLLKKDLQQISLLDENWESQLKSWLVEFLSTLGYWPKNTDFHQDVYQFIGDIASRPLFSPSLLRKLSAKM